MRGSITVSALNRYVKILLETDEVLSQIWVEGEITGFKIHASSGHAYFSLGEGGASVRCVMFRESVERVRFVVDDGMYAVLRCRVSLYERDGSFQLYVDDIMPKGAGSARQELDRLREQLEKEGLFSPERRRALPAFPKNIAVVTSASGAALHDIITIAKRRNPLVKLTLFPVNVQGQLAVGNICEAVSKINISGDIDMVIIARGGGSAEDLWYFNAEKLVRAASTLKVPFISAVGHETDWTLLDYGADESAPTPSAAAERAVPEINTIMNYMRVSVEETYAAALYKIENADELMASLRENTHIRANGIIENVQRKAVRARENAEALDPARVLARGYALAFDKAGGAITSAAQTEKGDIIEIALREGALECTVERKLEKSRWNK